MVIKGVAATKPEVLALQSESVIGEYHHGHHNEHAYKTTIKYQKQVSTKIDKYNMCNVYLNYISEHNSNSYIIGLLDMIMDGGQTENKDS